MSGRVEQRDAGFSLIEVLVGMMLIGVLGGVLGTMLISTGRSVDRARSQVDITEEARLALNRMSRELRQAQRIVAVYPAGSGTSGLTIEVDFSGDGVIQPLAADPEQLTYCFRGDQVLLSPGTVDCGAATGLPIVTAKVSSFSLEYFSSYQANGVAKQTWQQLDAAGNNNGLDGAELARVDAVKVSIQVRSGAQTERFQTTVDLRNR